MINDQSKFFRENQQFKNYLLRQLLIYGKGDPQFSIALDETDDVTKDFISQVMADLDPTTTKN